MESKYVEIDRYKNRRRMTWSSFILIVVVGSVLLSFGLIDDEKAQRINTLSFLIGTLFGVWTTIVIAYFGANAVTDVMEIKNKATTRNQDEPPGQ